MSVERELAIHETEIKHLQADMDRLVQDMEDIKKTLASINTTLAEARGGWKFLMMFGGAAGTIGSVITWVAAHWLGK